MLNSDKALLLVVDVQGRLAQLVHARETLFANLGKIIRGSRVLGIPILWTEQNPDGLGRTIPEVAELLAGINPITKMSFSCCREEHFVRALEATRRSQVLIAGIEAHVCVYQTALGLIESGYEVEVVADAVSSRRAENREIALAKMRDAGAGLTSTETVLFELLKTAEHEKFRDILKIVK